MNSKESPSWPNPSPQCPRYYVDGMRVGKANNYAKVKNQEAFLDNLPEGALAAGSTNTLVYSKG